MQRIVRTILLITILTLAMAGTAVAESRGFGARAQGMGGAFTAVADDGTAAYWNPAGLAQVKAISITPSLGVQGDWQEALDTYLENKDNDRPTFGDMQASFDGIVGVNFQGIGVNATLYSQLDAEKNASSMISDGSGSAVASLTLAQEFTPFFALGTNIKVLKEERFRFRTDDLLPNDTDLNYREEAEADGLAVDIGGQFKIGTMIRAGAVVRNVGPDLDFKGSHINYVNQAKETIRFSESLPTSIAAGLAVSPPMTGFLIAGDVEHFTETGENRVHIGAEQSILGIVKLRAGVVKSDLQDGLEYALGTGIQVGPATIDLSTQGDDSDGFNAVYLSAGFQW